MSCSASGSTSRCNPSDSCPHVQKQRYQDLGAHSFDECDREAVKRRAVKRLHQLGFNVTFHCRSWPRGAGIVREHYWESTTKKGTKRRVLTGRRGAPLAVVVTGANTPDKMVALETVDGVGVPGPERVVYRLHHLCLDKGYDYDDVTADMLERDYILHLKHRGDPVPEVAPEKKHPARRWAVERTHAWHNKFRRLLVRWERNVEHYKALVHLASVLILYRLIITA